MSKGVRVGEERRGNKQRRGSKQLTEGEDKSELVRESTQRTRVRDSVAPPYLWFLTISDKAEKNPS